MKKIIFSLFVLSAVFLAVSLVQAQGGDKISPPPRPPRDCPWCRGADEGGGGFLGRFVGRLFNQPSNKFKTNCECEVC